MATPRANQGGARDDAPKEYVTFRDFGSLNRQAIRTAIPRNDFSYLQNLMPVGNANMQTVRSAALNVAQNFGAGVQAVKGWSVNLLGMLTVSGVSGNFAVPADDFITGSISGAKSQINAVNGNVIEYGAGTAQFVVGETVTATFSGATGLVTASTNADWALAGMSDGSLWAENLSSPSPVFAQIAPPGTGITDVSSWSDTVALLIGPKGYYSWSGQVAAPIVPIVSTDGVTLTYVLLQGLIVTAVTGAYTVGETVTGGTSHATGTVYFWDPAFNQLFLTIPTTGTFASGETITGGTSLATGTYTGDVPTVAPTTGAVYENFGSFNPNGQIVTADSSNQVLGLNNVNGTFTTGGVLWQGSFMIGGIDNVDVSAPPGSGEFIAVYAGRVWVSDGRTVLFSGPGDYSAFSWVINLGSGSFAILDTTLKGSITRLIVANGYLYLFGPTSIDIVSNVYVPAGTTPPLPLFTRTNINAVVGTPFSQSVVIYDRLICFYNEFGIWALSGVQVERISEKIDGIIQQINQSGPGLISAGVGMCNNLLTATFLVNWYDPTVSTAISRQVILSFFDGKWFLYDPFNISPTGTMMCLFPATVGDTPSSVLLYTTGADPSVTSNVYQLFRSLDVPISRSLQTALWDLGLSIMVKQAIRFGVEGQVNNLEFSLLAQVDSERTSSAPVDFLPGEFVWVAFNLQPFTWLTAGGDEFVWTSGGYTYNYSDVTQYGRYLGITATGITGDAVISGLNLEYERRSGAKWELVQ